MGCESANRCEAWQIRRAVRSSLRGRDVFMLLRLGLGQALAIRPTLARRAQTARLGGFAWRRLALTAGLGVSTAAVSASCDAAAEDDWAARLPLCEESLAFYEKLFKQMVGNQGAHIG